jgi:hypothetical protein
VDDVLLVTRLGSSNLGQLSRLGDVLEQNDIRPSGFVVVGVGTSDEQTYYLAARQAREGGGSATDRDRERERERDQDRLSSAEV